jgi:hypothetical protein
MVIRYIQDLQRVWVVRKKWENELCVSISKGKSVFDDRRMKKYGRFLNLMTQLFPIFNTIYKYDGRSVKKNKTILSYFVLLCNRQSNSASVSSGIYRMVNSRIEK